MLRATHSKGKSKSYGRRNSRTRFPGIVKDAEVLDVHRITLYRTLTGEWKLPGLLRRYRALKGGAK